MEGGVGAIEKCEDGIRGALFLSSFTRHVTCVTCLPLLEVSMEFGAHQQRERCWWILEMIWEISLGYFSAIDFCQWSIYTFVPRGRDYEDFCRKICFKRRPNQIFSQKFAVFSLKLAFLGSDWVDNTTHQFKTF